MKSILLAVFTFCSSIVFCQSGSGVFLQTANIGKPNLAGTVEYKSADQSYKLKGGGYNIWFNRDEFFYLFNKLKGDFILTANVKLLGVGKDPHRKIGWMIRETEQEDAAHVSATVHGDGLTVLQWRSIRGAYMRDPQDQFFFPKKNIEIIQLERSGKKISMRAANPGEPLQLVGEREFNEMPDNVLVGLFICSHNPNEQEEGLAWNVRIEKPVADTFNAYRQGFLGSRMEIMNVFDGKRKVIHEIKGRFEAPNWMPDGKKLLFNQDGWIYTIPIEGGTPEKLNTGIANRNNNDHVISFDGKLLAISHHRDGMSGGGSTIYTLPLSGGEPKLVTDSTPSYLHGWNPNNKEVVYVAQRKGSPAYNLYKKSITGGPEQQLTFNQKSHVDGPEYSPDGKYIYYNANETGTMQLWRMKPDGTAREQLTFDEYHNWFPHISPDGKWIAFLSFPPHINADDHPFYKRVMLRLMPVNGGAGPKVIAYLYGGQGTINTPSWSPDSKQIAFVSNSGPL